MATRSLLILVTARSVCILLECFLVPYGILFEEMLLWPYEGEACKLVQNYYHPQTKLRDDNVSQVFVCPRGGGDVPRDHYLWCIGPHCTAPTPDMFCLTHFGHRGVISILLLVSTQMSKPHRIPYSLNKEYLPPWRTLGLSYSRIPRPPIGTSNGGLCRGLVCVETIAAPSHICDGKG